MSQVIVADLKVGQVVKSIETVRINGERRRELALRVRGPIGCDENSSQAVMRSGILCIFRDKAAILLLGFGVVTMLEIQLSRIEARVDVLWVCC